MIAFLNQSWSIAKKMVAINIMSLSKTDGQNILKNDCLLLGW